MTSDTAAIRDNVQISHALTFFSSFVVLHDSLLQNVSIQLYFACKLSYDGHQIFVLWLFFFTILEVNTYESLDVCVVCSTIIVRATLHLSLSLIAAVSDVKLWS